MANQYLSDVDPAEDFYLGIDAVNYALGRSASRPVLHLLGEKFGLLEFLLLTPVLLPQDLAYFPQLRCFLVLLLRI